MAKPDVYKEITDQILTLMREHGADWLKPWTASAGSELPYNVETGNRYSGGNVIMLSIVASKRGYSRNVWGTFKQWEKLGAKIRPGQNKANGQGGTLAYNVGSIVKTDKDTGEEKLVKWLNTFYLFNVDQVEGYSLEPKTEPTAFDVHETAEKWIAATGASITHGGDVACFIPSTDQIRMPERESFVSADAYYSTAFHELTHWTGAHSRLDRIKHSRFGDSAYSLEELVAELGAAFQCALTGVTDEPRADHAKYINGWIKALENDKSAFASAASAAQKAVDLIESYQGEAKATKAA